MVLLDNFFQHFLHWLIKADQQLFTIINTKLTCSFLDNIFPAYREITTWYPFYLALIVFIIYKYKWKGFYWLLAVILAVSISDIVSSRLIKDFVDRARPCQDAYMQLHTRLLLGRCPTSYSFTSSHATNHFTLAVMFFYTLKHVFKKWSYLFFIWAATIAYGQVYVGVHYPLDVFAGAILGSGIGFTLYYFYNKLFYKQQLYI